MAAKTDPAVEDIDSDDENDEEPCLKYQHLTGEDSRISKHTSVTCIHVHLDQFVVLGTADAEIIIVSDGKERCRFQPHRFSIKSISMDRLGLHVASCSDNGSVAINEIKITKGGGDNNELQFELTGHDHTFKFPRPLNAVQLDPDYFKTKIFFTGGIDGNLCRNKAKKKRLAPDMQIIHKGEGAITTIKWLCAKDSTSLLAWTNDLGVKVFDTRKDVRLAFIEKPAPFGAVEGRCHLSWHAASEHESTLLIGWSSSIIVVRVTRQSNLPGVRKHAPYYRFEVTQHLQTAYLICGLCPYGPDRVVVAALPKETKEPEIHVVDRATGATLSEEIVLPDGYQHHSAARHCSLEVCHMSVGKSPMYLVCPRDVVIIQERDTNDHLEWAIVHSDFESALKIVEAESGLDASVRAAVVTRYLSHLFYQEKYKEAAGLCPRLLQKDGKQWSFWIKAFLLRKQVQLLYKYIPTRLGGGASASSSSGGAAAANPFGSSPRLLGGSAIDEDTYGLVLREFVENDPMVFLELLQKWARPRCLYRITSVLHMLTETKHALSTKMQHSASQHEHEHIVSKVVVLTDALAQLDAMNGRPEQALSTYLSSYKLWQVASDQMLRKRAESVAKFEVHLHIKENRLYELVRWKILPLVTVGRKDAAMLLVQNMQRFHIKLVMQQLTEDPTLQLLYLDTLCKHNLDHYDQPANRSWQDKHVELLVEHEPKNLLPFLRQTNYWDHDKTLALCDSKVYDTALFEPLVYVQERKKDMIGAMNTILENLQDIPQTIEFIRRHSLNHADELWAMLIKYAEKKKVGALTASTDQEELMGIGLIIDAVADYSASIAKTLIQRLPNLTLEHVKGLNKKFLHILLQQKNRKQLHESCFRTQASECVQMNKRHMLCQNRAVRVGTGNGESCAICAKPVLSGPDANAQDVDVFFCGHVYHSLCLEMFCPSEESQRLAGATICMPKFCPKCVEKS